MKYAEIGSISHATLRTDDLLEAFANELDYQCNRNKGARGNGERRKLVKEANRMLVYWRPDGRELVSGLDLSEPLASDINEQSHYLVNETLPDALHEFAAPYVMFGAHEGDGSDFGYWPYIEGLEEDTRTGDVLKVEDLADIPEDFQGEIMLVNDHGNVTYGWHTSNGTFKSVWSCV